MIKSIYHQLKMFTIKCVYRHHDGEGDRGKAPASDGEPSEEGVPKMGADEISRGGKGRAEEADQKFLRVQRSA